jgi:hypothetical protein
LGQRRLVRKLQCSWRGLGDEGSRERRSPVVVVADLNDAWDIAIDDQNIYYGTAGTKGENRCDASLEKVPLGGGTPTVIARQQCWVLRIALDADHVYFATSSAGFPYDSTPFREDAGIIKAPK